MRVVDWPDGIYVTSSITKYSSWPRPFPLLKASINIVIFS